jgi:hypothetical protein
VKSLRFAVPIISHRCGFCYTMLLQKHWTKLALLASQTSLEQNNLKTAYVSFLSTIAESPVFGISSIMWGFSNFSRLLCYF